MLQYRSWAFVWFELFVLVDNYSTSKAPHPHFLAKVLGITLPVRISQYLLGVLTGLILATHVVAGIHAAFGIGLFMAVFFRPQRAVHAILKAYVLVSSVSVLVFHISPNNTIDTLRGIIAHGTSAGSIEIKTNVFLVWFRATDYPFLIIPTTVGVVLLLLIAKQRFYMVESRGLFVISSVLLGISVVYFSLLDVRRIHYLLAFSPMFFVFVVSMCIHYSKYNSNVTQIVRVGILCALLLPSLGLLRHGHLFYHYNDEITYERARDKYAWLTESLTDNYVLISDRLWILSEDYEQLRTKPQGMSIELVDSFQFGAEVGTIILEQHQSGLQSPPESVAGFYMTHDFFIKKTYTFLGIPIANTTPSYAFAVYQRR